MSNCNPHNPSSNPPYKPLKQGVLREKNSLEIALFSTQASSIFFQLFSPDGQELIQRIPLIKDKDSLWKGRIHLPDCDMTYTYLVDNVEVNDPYATALSTPFDWLSGKYAPKGQFTFDHTFNWDGISPPLIADKDQIIYEMHVRGFTNDLTNNSSQRGTFLGLIEKIPYLKRLGINTVELMPIFEFDENDNSNTNPLTGEKLVNYWGYNTLNFFCPMKRYTSSCERLAPINELKTLVKEFHRNGLRVVLDVVYNHVSSAMRLEDIDKSNYFILSEDQKHTNYTGCGNTLWANSDASMNLILSSLRYFAKEFHIDGFRFDLGGALARGQNGKYLEKPRLFDAIVKDEILSAKFITAEPWDAHDSALKGKLGNEHISEWNGGYKDTIRQFLNHQNVQGEQFSNAFLGIDTVFSGNKLLENQVHYVTTHDGFSLSDLVSFKEKHNEANGEDNLDGENNNFSNNWGEEGTSSNECIVQKREQSIKNFLLANLTSVGIPMISMGDEYGLTHNGNNNTYCQDGPINWFNWELLEKNKEQMEFVSTICKYRKERITNAEKIVPIHGENGHVAILYDNEIVIAFNMGENEFDVSTSLEGEWKVALSSSLKPSLQLEPNTSLMAILQTL